MYFPLPCVLAQHCEDFAHRVAIIESGREYTYGQLARHLPNFIEVLAKQKLSRGAIVAIECGGFYEHILWVLACEALGLVSLSYIIGGNQVLDVDFVLCTTPPKTSKTTPCFFSSIERFNALLKQVPAKKLADYDFAPFSDDTPLRIVESSGTTGSPKQMVRTVKQHVFRHRQTCERMGYNSDTRDLICYPFILQIAYSNVVCCLRVGGTCVFDRTLSPFEAFEHYHITHVSLVLEGVIRLMDELPETYPKNDKLVILVIGGQVTPDLRTAVCHRLSQNLMESYGTNEAGIVASVDGQGITQLLPDIELQIVDENDKLLPYGQVGHLRIRSDAGVSGYLNDPQATQKSFKEGWFYPGDLGVMQDETHFRLIGRRDNILNIDGVKYSAELCESLMEKDPLIKDVCLSSMQDALGHTVVLLAYSQAGVEGKALLLENLKEQLPHFWKYVFIQEIPQMVRTPSGKIQRQKVTDFMKEQFLKSARS